MEIMESKRQNLFQHAMAYGVVMGGLFSANFMLSTMGRVGNMLSYLVIGAIAYCTYYFACLFRDRECEGVLSYGKGLSYIVMLYFFLRLSYPLRLSLCFLHGLVLIFLLIFLIRVF